MKCYLCFSPQVLKRNDQMLNIIIMVLALYPQVSISSFSLIPIWPHTFHYLNFLLECLFISTCVFSIPSLPKNLSRFMSLLLFPSPVACWWGGKLSAEGCTVSGEADTIAKGRHQGVWRDIPLCLSQISLPHPTRLREPPWELQQGQALLEIPLSSSIKWAMF